MHYLHSAPSNEEKFLYLNQNKFGFYLLAIISTLMLTSGSVLFSFHKVHFVWFFAYTAVVFAYLLVSYIIGVFSKPFSLDSHYRNAENSRIFYPSVDIFLPSCGEPIHIIDNTYKWVKRMRSHWGGKTFVYVLDDAANQEVKALAESYGFTYLVRPNRGELKKAGNIRYGFSQSHSPFIVIFDADFCPRPDFLHELIPYFSDEKVAIVQSPQFFEFNRLMSWIEKGAASIQELFYRLIQTNRNHWGGSICVGSNAIYRRSALEPYGGTYPIQHSEDLHTGFNLLKDGWKIEYVPLNLAKGRCPDYIPLYFTQQYRWCFGSTSLLFNKQLFWKSKLPIMTRLCYLSGMFYYVITAVGVFLAPIPGLLMLAFSPENIFWYNSSFSVPSFVFSVLYMKLWNKQPFGLYTLKARWVSYYAHIFALFDKLTSSMMEWVPTGNRAALKNSSKRVKHLKWVLLFWPSMVFALGALGCAFRMKSWMDFDFYPYIFFTIFYSYLQVSPAIELWKSDFHN